MSPSLDQTFAALSDPPRRGLLAGLATLDARGSGLAEPLLGARSRPGVTKHLRVLERAGLIDKGRDAQRRPCRLNAQALRHASSWMETYRAHWEDSLDRLDAYLKGKKDVRRK